MKLWRIRGFDEGPHWDAAFIWADGPEEAREILRAKLGSGEDDHPDTVWSPQEDGWTCIEVTPEKGVVFVLGAGCRG